MRLRFSFVLAAVVGLAAAGCAGTNVTPGLSAANPALRASAGGLGTVHAPGNFGATNRGAPAVRVKPDKASYLRALYIADYSNNNVKILTNTYYHDLGVISDGIANPVAAFSDEHGNLYVANEPFTSSNSISEYAPGATSPSFTYNANLGFILGGTVDRDGNVYAVDQSVVNEYFQGVNVVSQTCSSNPTSVAVDRSGNVFVGTFFGVYEYSGGLSGCNATALNSISSNQMVLDGNDDLIVTDSVTNAVEVIDPPYTNVSRTIASGLCLPYGLSLSKKNKFLFVAEECSDTIVVYNYQTGQPVKVITGSSYGVSTPYGVVDDPNAVY